MTIKAVLFDLWGTLIHADIEDPREILQGILASLRKMVESINQDNIRLAKSFIAADCVDHTFHS